MQKLLIGAFLATCAAPSQAAEFLVATQIVGTSGVIAQHSRSSDKPLTSEVRLAAGWSIARATADGGGEVYAQVAGTTYGYAARAELTFGISIVGPDLEFGETIPVSLVTRGYADTLGELSPTTQARASISIDTPTPFLIAVNSTINGFQPFDFSGQILMIPNVLYKVSLLAYAQGGNSLGSGYTLAEAIVDPIFSLSPEYSDYRLVGRLRPGAYVPEPATWAMMIAGLSLTGWAMRRRKASVAFP